MDQTNGTTPASVSSSTAKQAGEVQARWAWVEPSVWTERMLTALEDGVKGGTWFSLIDKVLDPANLESAFARVARNKGAAGVDHQTVAMYEDRLEANLKHLRDVLKEGTYYPQAVKRVWIPKPGSDEKRPLGIPTVRDRIAQAAVRNVIEPIFERDFAAHSYGFRPGRGCPEALDRVDALLKAGYVHVVDADLKSYFDTIPHARLLERIRARISDGRVLRLIASFLAQGVMDGLTGWTPTAGAPQGAVISPLLSNIYLDPFDHLMAASGIEMVRYADDLVILCRSREDAESALEMMRRWVAEAGLTLHPQKTKIVHAESEGFEFLGYRFENRTRFPREKSLTRLKTTIRSKTKRTNGHSLGAIIHDVNRTLRGWFEYFKRSNSTPFRPLDGWIRMRLRSLLRRRSGGKGRGHGRDHQRWPNAFFAERGLFCLTTAHATYRQSAVR